MNNEFGFTHLRQQALNFVRICRDSSAPYAYAMLPGKPSLLMGSGNAAIFYRLFGAIQGLSAEQRNQWADYLNAGQRDDGYIFESWLTEDDWTSRSYIKHWEHVVWHNSRIAIMGLMALGRPPAKRLKFIHRFLEKGAILDWLDSVDWGDFWRVSNEIYDLAFYLGIEAEAFHDERAQAGVKILLDELVRRQEPTTGFWASDKNTSIPAMAGAFHLYPIFIQNGREVPWPDRIIDSTLATRQPNGYFWPQQGGNYAADLDATHILANMTRMTDHRRTEVEDAMRALRSLILPQMRPDGGFPPGSFTFNCYIKQAKADSDQEAALWCALFRYMTLGLIDCTLDRSRAEKQWDFRGIFNAILYPVDCGFLAPD